MKFAFFDDFELALVVGDRLKPVANVIDVSRGSPQERLQELIRRYDELRPALLEHAANGPEGPVLSSVTLRPPVPRPGQLICAIRNYIDGRPRSEEPDFFLKSPLSVTGTGATVTLPGIEARVFHHEPELAVVIRGDGRGVSTERAMEHVFGYTGFLDVSARDAGGSFYRKKSFPSFGPMGPILVTADEIADPGHLHIRLWVDDALRQDFSTDQMDHSIPELVASASSVSGIETGDVIASGTYHLGMGPLQDGNRVAMEIEGIGTLTANVTDPLKRHWDV